MIEVHDGMAPSRAVLDVQILRIRYGNLDGLNERVEKSGWFVILLVQQVELQVKMNELEVNQGHTVVSFVPSDSP